MKALLSIIIPMYNAQDTIERCIESVENQKVDFCFEIIVVDDGSTDKSVDIVKKLQINNDNIKLFQQKNMKQAMARNNGLKVSNGKFIMFFDADDTIESNMLGLMTDKVDMGNDLVMCGIRKKYDSKEIIESDPILRGFSDKSELIINYLTKNKELDVGLWNKIFLSKIIKNNNIDFSNDNFFEDSLFVLKYLCCCNVSKIKYIDENLYNLYKHDGSTTMHFDSKIDLLSKSYLDKVRKVLSINHIVLDPNIMNAINVRIYLYVVHHHIKFDDAWNEDKQKKYLSVFNISSLKLLKYLSFKYKWAFIMAKFFPKVYAYVYTKYKA